MSLRILVADDHRIMRAGLCTLLNAEPDLEVIGEADSGEEVIDLASQQAPDIVLMDLSMPGMGGIEATRQLVKQNPKIRVLILSMHEEKVMIREAIQAGAAGYILKRAIISDLIQAIQVVMDGDLYVHSTLARALFSEQTPAVATSSSKVDTLTAREVETLRLIARGYANNQIAEALTISVRTVEYHRGNLMAKLNARSRMDLVRFASEHGYLGERRKSSKDA